MAFSRHFNVLIGNNGMGKTNVLDAIYYLCLSKSYFSTPDKQVIQHDGDFFRLEGLFTLNKAKETIVIKVKKGRKKEIERNASKYNKIAEHIGLLPIVFITPDDNSLIKDGSQERRKFLDNTLVQQDSKYLTHLLRYNLLLKQRNAALKKMAETNRIDHNLLDTYDQQMAAPAQAIFESRIAMTERLSPFFQTQYNIISNEAEKVGLSYRTQLQENHFLSLVKKNRQKDIILQRSTIGPHKDDLVFTLNGRPVKQIASQGQLKTYVIALKLAQYQVLKLAKKHPPILLLDDIFDKLDNQRVTALVKMLTEGDYGQIFITDTEKERISQIIKATDTEVIEFKIDEGTANKR